MAEEIKKEEGGTDTAESKCECTEGEKKCKKAKADKKAENELLSLKAELEKLNAELLEQKEQHLRLAAEYDNFRRRSKAEREGVYSDACSDVVNEFLPVLDNIERAAAFTDDEKVAEGINMMAKAFRDSLARLGVSEIECKTFDPNFHNAVMHIEDESYGEGEITEVFQKGYVRGERVLRYAMVKTAN